MRPPFHEVEGQDIRLVKIVKGDPSDAICCELEVNYLASRRRYEALSWCWGQLDALTDPWITLSNCLHQIPANLQTALGYLRSKDEDRWLWCDALCIDQRDERDKSHQISLMASIYKLADRVIVWLGEEDNQGIMRSAMGQMTGLQTIFREHPWTWPSSKQDWWPEEVKRADAISDKVKGCVTYVDHLVRFFERPWFGRLWVIQEVCLADFEITAMCGHISMPFRNAYTICDLRTVINYGHLDEKHWSDQLSDIASLFSLIRAIRARRKVPFLEKLWFLHKQECSLPQDRIFALAAIEGESSKLLDDGTFRLHYNTAFLSVYTDFAMRVLDFEGTLNILNYCSNPVDPHGRPSWVPDWSIPLSNKPFLGLTRHKNPGEGIVFAPEGASVQAPEIFPYKADEHYHQDSPRPLGGSLPLFQQKPDFEISENMRYLSVKGYMISTVQNIASLKPVKSTKIHLGLDVTQKSRTGALWDILADEDNPATYAVKSWVASVYPLKDYDEPQLRKMIRIFMLRFDEDHPNSSTAQVCEEFLARTDHYGDKRSLFIADDGQIGLGPQYMQVGDAVVFFLGAQTQFMVRPLSDGRYRLLEDCILGYRFLWRFDLTKAIDDGKYQASRFVLE